MQYKVRRAMGWMLHLYLLVLLVINPFYMQDKYSKLGRAKFELFRNSSIFFLGLLLLGLVWYLVLGAKAKEWKKITLSMLDKFAICYLMVTVVSFALSSYQEDGFWGMRGWSMGLFSQIVFLLIYFMVSRFWSNKNFLWAVAGVSTTGVFLIGILHRFLVDPLGLYEGLEESLQVQFLSTLGQATWYSSFLCVCFPIGMGMYWYSKNRWMRFFSGLYTGIAMASVVTQNSDSAFVALGAVMLVLFWLAFENQKKMIRFIELCLIVLISFQIIGVLQQIFWYQAVELEPLSLFMSQSTIVKSIIAIFLLLYVVMMICKNIDLEEWTFIRNTVFIVTVMAVIGMVLFIYCNTTDIFYDKYGYQNDANYLKFDDDWGNGRGSSWKLAWKVLGEMSWKDKVFGVGPDCFSSYAYGDPVYAQILQDKWGDSNLINVHNEFLNSMICYGILGVISYVGIFVTAFIRFVRRVLKSTGQSSPIILGATLSVIAYVGHNFFCYQQVLCTPYVFLLMGMGEALLRKTEKK